MALKNQNLGTQARVIFAGRSLGCLYSIGDHKMSRADIDITCYGSTFRRFTGGLATGGTLDLEIGNGSEAIIQMLDAFMDNSIGRLKLLSPDGGQMECDAYVSGYSNSYKIDDVLRTTVTFTLSGPPVFTPPLIISPQRVTLKYGATQQFTANYDVDWDVYNPAIGTSTIDQTGVFTLTSSDYISDVTIRATTRTGETAYATVIVDMQEVVIEPSDVVLVPGDTLQFAANVPVVWDLATKNVAKGTKISPTGVLEIDPLETVKGLSIRATSAYADSDTAYVSVFTVYPLESDVMPGERIQFLSSVPCVWSIRRGTPTSAETVLDANTGLFVYSANERTPEFGICATETQSGTEKQITATVRLKNMPVRIEPTYTVTGLHTSVQYTSNMPAKWRITTPGTAKNTHITEDGLLHVSREELNDQLVIAATSVYGQEATAIAQILRITPAQITLMRGGTQQFTANMPVQWAITTETTDPDTKITENGYLTFGYNELAYELQIAAKIESGAVAYATAALADIPLMITPSDMDIAAGTSFQFTSNLPATWSLAGMPGSPDTNINPETGELYVGAGETSNMIRVRATSGRGQTTTAIAYPIVITPRFGEVLPGVPFVYHATNPARVTWVLPTAHSEYTEISKDGVFVYSDQETEPRITVRVSSIRYPDIHYDAIAAIDYLPVEVTPREVVLAPTYPLDFACNVPCVWKIETDGVEDYTTIDEKTGRFVMDADERCEQIVVSAKSYYNQYGLAVIRTLIIVPYAVTLDVGTSRYLRASIDGVQWGIISDGHVRDTAIDPVTGEITIGLRETKSIVLVSATLATDAGEITAIGVVNVAGIEFHIEPEYAIVPAGQSQVLDAPAGVVNWAFASQHHADTVLEIVGEDAVLHVSPDETTTPIKVRATSGQGITAESTALIYYVAPRDIEIKAGGSQAITASMASTWAIDGDVMPGTVIDKTSAVGDRAKLIVDPDENNPVFSIIATELVSGDRKTQTIRVDMQSVIITPADIIMIPGDTVQFACNRPMPEWAIVGEHHEDTKINPDGTLIISPAETSDGFTVRASVSMTIHGDASVHVYRVSPQYHVIPLGGSCVFSANLPTTWALVSPVTGETYIDADGRFVCDKHETQRQFNVRAGASESAEYPEPVGQNVRVYIDTIDITPKNPVTTIGGDPIQFAANPSTGVRWAVDGVHQPGTVIDPDTGILSIDDAEVVDHIRINAASAYASGTTVCRLFCVVDGKFDMLLGSTRQLHHTLVGDVEHAEWALEGTHSLDTTINSTDGTLHIGDAEQAAEITIVCTGYIGGSAYHARAYAALKPIIVTPALSVLTGGETVDFDCAGAAGIDTWKILTAGSTSAINSETGVFALSNNEPNSAVDIQCTRVVGDVATYEAFARVYNYVVTPGVEVAAPGSDVVFASTTPCTYAITSDVDFGTEIRGDNVLHISDSETHDRITVTATETVSGAQKAIVATIYVAAAAITVSPPEWIMPSGTDVEFTASESVETWVILTPNSHASITETGKFTMQSAESAPSPILVGALGANRHVGVATVIPYIIHDRVVNLRRGERFTFDTDPDSVEWAIQGQQSRDTKIEVYTGTLQIGLDETSNLITVLATPVHGVPIHATVNVTDIGFVIDPADVDAYRGDTITFRALGGTPVDCRIDDDVEIYDPQTKLVINTDSTATLTIGDHEGQTTIRITATSDQGVQARATVHLLNAALVVIPAERSIPPGGDYQFRTNFPNARLGWYLDGQYTDKRPDGTRVDSTGHVWIGTEETATDIAVIAYIRQDPQMVGSALIRIGIADRFVDTDYADMALAESRTFALIEARRARARPNVAVAGAGETVKIDYIPPG